MIKTNAITRNLKTNIVQGLTELEAKLPPQVLVHLYKMLAKELLSLDMPMSEVYSQYSTDYREWIVPPLILPKYLFNSKPLQERIVHISSRVIFNRYVAGLVKANKTQNPHAVADFAVKYVIFALRYIQVSTYHFDADNSYCVLDNGRVLGIKNRKLMGATIPFDPSTMQDISSLVHSPRGTVKMNTFDFLDQIKMWMESNREKVKNYESLEYALAILKIRGTWDSTYALQQLLYRGNPKEKTSKLLYTDELLESIRTMWEQGGLDLGDRYTELSGMVSHLNIPYKTWIGMFKMRTKAPGAKLLARQKDLVINGYEAFLSYFLLEQEKERLYVDRFGR